jgi:hypothetical protein
MNPSTASAPLQMHAIDIDVEVVIGVDLSSHVTTAWIGVLFAAQFVSRISVAYEALFRAS